MTQVSIIIPAYNAERYIGDALESVVSNLPEDWEIIVVNDHSSDCTSEVVKKFPIVKLIESTRKGVTAARIEGAKIASGEFILFMDADDILTDGAIHALNKTLTENPDADIIIGDTLEINISEEIVSPYGFHEIRNGHQLFNWIIDNRKGFIWGKLIRKDLFMNLELIPYDLRFCEDYTQMLQIAYKAKHVVHCQSIVYGYKQNPTSVCNSVKPRKEFAENFLRFSTAIHTLATSSVFTDDAQRRLRVMFLYYMRLYLWVAGTWRNIDSDIKHDFKSWAQSLDSSLDPLYTKSRKTETLISGYMPWLPASFYVPLLRYKFHRIK